jgi:transposase-like protein
MFLGTYCDFYICPQCGKMYKYLSSLNLHLKFRCGVEPKFKCESCKKRFALKHHWRRHMISVHNNILKLQL